MVQIFQEFVEIMVIIVIAFRLWNRYGLADQGAVTAGVGGQIGDGVNTFLPVGILFGPQPEVKIVQDNDIHRLVVPKAPSPFHFI